MNRDSFPRLFARGFGLAAAHLRYQRLTSIPGIGERLAVTILGELPNLSKFRSAKALSAFAGLCPREVRSGKSISKSWLSRSGNVHVRHMLYMPAIVAMRCNPVLKPYADRLRTAGKRGKQIIAAVMRRLLILAYGVVKSGQPFDPEHRVWATSCRSHGRSN